ncbi:MAG: S8 family serine peptidase, partial [Candidatus Diapherotrites archaeon]|nr:S8 family serine peptidase [Candidatus Diapherotrites archaeon]
GSFSTDVNSPINLAVADAVEFGAVVVVSAGNCGEGCPDSSCGSFRGVGVPANSADAITVGAVNDSNQWACFSSGGVVGTEIKPDLSAPGVNIDSAGLGALRVSKSGTSMSAPMVSGLVALMREANPSLSPVQIKDWLESHAIDLGSPGKDVQFGSGLVNASRMGELRAGPDGNGGPVFLELFVPDRVRMGLPVELRARVMDPGGILSVQARVRFPSGEDRLIDLIASENEWWMNSFMETTQTGSYLVELRARNGGGLESVWVGSFLVSGDVNEGGGDRNVSVLSEGLMVPEQLNKLGAGLVSLRFSLTAPQESALDVVPADTTVAFVVKDSFGNPVDKEFVGPLELVAGQAADFNFVWVPSAVSDYNVEAQVLNEGIPSMAGEKSSRVVVAVDSARLAGVDFGESRVRKGDARLVKVSVSNDSAAPLDMFAEIHFVEGGQVADAWVSPVVSVNADSNYAFDFNEPVLLNAGNYDLNVLLHYENRALESLAGSWEVFTPSTGSLGSVQAPAQVNVDADWLLGIGFLNQGTDVLHPWMEAEVKDSNGVLVGVLSGNADVNAGETVVLNEVWTARVPAGAYDVNAVVGYEEHRLYWQGILNVVDAVAPQLVEWVAKTPVRVHEPMGLQVILSDASELTSVQVQSGSSSSVLRKAGGSDRNSFWSGSLVFSQPGFLNADLNACDASGNCALFSLDSLEVRAWAPACEGKKLLWVSGEARSVQDSCAVNRVVSQNGVPSLEEALFFDGLVWNEGAGGVMKETGKELISEWLLNGRRVLVLGSDVGLANSSDAFLSETLHASWAKDVAGGELRVVRPHPLTLGWNSLVLDENNRNADALNPLNDAVSLAEWSEGESGLMAWEDSDSGAGVGLAGFDQNALSPATLRWLTERPQTDAVLADVNIPSFAVEGTVPIELNLSLPSEPVNVSVYSDGMIVFSGTVSDENAVLPVPLSAGVHAVRVLLNDGFAVPEKSYLNNEWTGVLNVAPSGVDGQLMDVISPRFVRAGVLNEWVINVRNGGGTAGSGTVRFELDGVEAAAENISLNAGETKDVNVSWSASAGMHSWRAGMILASDVNAFNDALDGNLFGCTRESVLVVADDEDGSGSMNAFVSALESNEYCAATRQISMEGLPSLSQMNDFNAVIWSAGTQWTSPLTSKAFSLLSHYSGNLLLEGADVGFAHAQDPVLSRLVSAEFDSDLFMESDENSVIFLDSNSFLSPVVSLDLNAVASPYPDAVSPLEGFTAGRWNDGRPAIVAYDDWAKKTIYYSFSFNAIRDSAKAALLLEESLSWMLSRPPRPFGVKLNAPQNELLRGTVSIDFNAVNGSTENARSDVYYSSQKGAFEHRIGSVPLSECVSGSLQPVSSIQPLLLGSVNDSRYASFSDLMVTLWQGNGPGLGRIRNMEVKHNASTVFSESAAPGTLVNWSGDTWAWGNDQNYFIKTQGAYAEELFKPVSWDTGGEWSLKFDFYLPDGPDNSLRVGWGATHVNQEPQNGYAVVVTLPPHPYIVFERWESDNTVIIRSSPVLEPGNWYGIEAKRSASGNWDLFLLDYSAPALQGNYSCSLDWNTAEVPDGAYFLDVNFSDGFQNAVDSGNQSVEVRNYASASIPVQCTDVWGMDSTEPNPASRYSIWANYGTTPEFVPEEGKYGGGRNYGYLDENGWFEHYPFREWDDFRQPDTPADSNVVSIGIQSNWQGGSLDNPADWDPPAPRSIPAQKLTFQCCLSAFNVDDFGTECLDNKAYSAFLPSVTNNNFKGVVDFFVTQDGSTYYADASHDGVNGYWMDGDPLDWQTAISQDNFTNDSTLPVSEWIPVPDGIPDHLARKATGG